MKCPKCGYHSFDDLKTCKKCQADLDGFKNKYGLQDFFSLSWGRKARKNESRQKVEPESAEPDLFSLSEPSPSLKMEPEIPMEVLAPESFPGEAEPEVAPSEESFSVESEGLSSLDLDSDTKVEDSWGDDASFDEFFAETDEPFAEFSESEVTDFEEPSSETAAEAEVAQVPDFLLEEETPAVEEFSALAEQPAEEAALPELAEPAKESLESDLFVELPASISAAPDPQLQTEIETIPAETIVPESAPAVEEISEFEEQAFLEEVPDDAEDEQVVAEVEEELFGDAEIEASEESEESEEFEDDFTSLEDAEIVEPESAADIQEPSVKLPQDDEILDAFFPPPNRSPKVEIPDKEAVEEQPALPFAAASEAIEDEIEELAEIVEDEEDDAEEVLEIIPPQVPLGSRLAASLIDLVLLAVSFLLFLVVGAKALSPAGSSSWLPELGDVLSMAIPYFLIFFTIGFCYFTLFHYMTGQTPGKMLCKFRVADEDGEPLLFSQAFLRSVGGLVCLFPVGLGFFSILLNSEQRGWDDQLAGTYVLPQEDEDQQEE